MNAPTKLELAKQRELGAAARRAGKQRHAGAFTFGHQGVSSERADLLNEAWLLGWDDEDVRRSRPYPKGLTE